MFLGHHNFNLNADGVVDTLLRFELCDRHVQSHKASILYVYEEILVASIVKFCEYTSFMQQTACVDRVSCVT